MQTNTNLTSETEGPLRRVASAALHGAPSGTGTAGQNLSRFSVSHTLPASYRQPLVGDFVTAGAESAPARFLSTDRADAGPTDKG